MKYFDAHCHIQFPEYDEDRLKLVQQMKDAGVGGIIVGADLASSEAAIQTATDVSGIIPAFASVGLHPNHADEVFDENKFRELARHPKVVAIGECGLDYYRPENAESVKGLQKTVFEQQLALAVELNKPLMIHARPARGSMSMYADLLDILRARKREYGDRLTGNAHFFTGGVEEARALLELDFTISFTAVLTFTSDYDGAVRFMPLSHILSETDAPYVAPAMNRGQRNNPLAVEEVVRAIARIRGTDEETVREATIENARRVFGLSAS